MRPIIRLIFFLQLLYVTGKFWTAITEGDWSRAILAAILGLFLMGAIWLYKPNTPDSSDYESKNKR